HFANHIYFRILTLDGGHPITPESSRRVLESVLANRVDAGDADPPHRVLNFVSGDLWIVLIQIRQDVDEPTIESFAPNLRCRVGITHRPGLPNISEMFLRSAIEPGRCWRIVYPGMIWPGVIRDLILDHFDPELMRLFHQLAQFHERPEMFFDAVEIDCPVS